MSNMETGQPEAYQAEVEEFERQIAEAIKKRVQVFFEGVDLSTKGTFKKGLMDIVVDDQESSDDTYKGRSAIASVNGIELAAMVIPVEGSDEDYKGTYRLIGQSTNQSDKTIDPKRYEICVEVSQMGKFNFFTYGVNYLEQGYLFVSLERPSQQAHILAGLEIKI